MNVKSVLLLVSKTWSMAYKKDKKMFERHSLK